MQFVVETCPVLFLSTLRDEESLLTNWQREISRIYPLPRYDALPQKKGKYWPKPQTRTWFLEWSGIQKIVALRCGSWCVLTGLTSKPTNCSSQCSVGSEKSNERQGLQDEPRLVLLLYKSRQVCPKVVRCMMRLAVSNRARLSVSLLCAPLKFEIATKVYLLDSCLRPEWWLRVAGVASVAVSNRRVWPRNTQFPIA